VTELSPPACSDRLEAAAGGGEAGGRDSWHDRCDGDGVAAGADRARRRRNARRHGPRRRAQRSGLHLRGGLPPLVAEMAEKLDVRAPRGIGVAFRIHHNR
jgi:hypothetical protein